jgi:hypothetical protein
MTQQKDDVFSSSAKRKWNQEHIIPSHLDMTISLRKIGFFRPW